MSRDERDGIIKLSFRSNKPFNVIPLASQWGGGGHPQAIGATFNSMEDFLENLDKKGNKGLVLNMPQSQVKKPKF